MSLRGPLLVLCLSLSPALVVPAAAGVRPVEGSLAPAAASTTPDELDDLLAELREQAEQAEVELVRAIADHRSRRALDGLLAEYAETPSAYIKRAILRELDTYDEVAGCEDDALEHLMNVAVGEERRELREAAMDTLAGCLEHGRTYLRMIVDSEAEQDLRMTALEAHLALRQDDDAWWYKRLYEDGLGIDRQRDEDGNPTGPRPLGRLRPPAFDAVVTGLTDEEVEEATEDPSGQIRIRALQELYTRGDKKVEKRALEVFEQRTEPWQVRVAAAALMLELDGDRFAKEMFKEAERNITPHAMRMALADLVAGTDDAKIRKLIVKGFGKGKAEGKLLYLRAAAGLDDPKLVKPLLKLLEDKDEVVRVAAASWAVREGVAEAAEVLEELYEDTEDPLRRAELLVGLARFQGDDEAWQARLEALVADPDPDLRNAALGQLVQLGPQVTPRLAEFLAHEDWSTRLTALRGLEQLRAGSAVGAIIAAFPDQTGRMRIEFGDSLFRMTGQFFGSRATPWRAWWEREGGDDFEVLTERELKVRIEERETLKLKELTSTEFFGIQIESERVVFVVDISGSMNELAKSRYVDAKGEPRIELAKGQLSQVLDALTQESRFNIITFASDVAPWADDIVDWTPDALADAQSFVGRLGASGGTNLYGALRFAFQDPQVDTVFVLSDGEPSAGAITDPGAIRGEVARWNANRRVRINTIAIGGRFQILKWLAEDTGGTHVRFE